MVLSLNPHLVGIKEYELRVPMNGHNLVGFCDHYCPDTKVLNENKTSQTLDKWTQKAVDLHKQLHMYSLLLLLKNNIKPEELKIFLNFVPVFLDGFFPYVKPDVFFRFETKRTTEQVLLFAAEITKTLKEMEKFAIAHKEI